MRGSITSLRMVNLLFGSVFHLSIFFSFLFNIILRQHSSYSSKGDLYFYDSLLSCFFFFCIFLSSFFKCITTWKDVIPTVKQYNYLLSAFPFGDLISKFPFSLANFLEIFAVFLSLLTLLFFVSFSISCH